MQHAAMKRKPATKAPFPQVCRARVFLVIGNQWRLGFCQVSRQPTRCSGSSPSMKRQPLWFSRSSARDLTEPPIVRAGRTRQGHQMRRLRLNAVRPSRQLRKLPAFPDHVVCGICQEPSQQTRRRRHRSGHLAEPPRHPLQRRQKQGQLNHRDRLAYPPCEACHASFWE